MCIYFHRHVLTFDIIIGTGSSLNYAIDKVKYAQLMAMTPISNVKTDSPPVHFTNLEIEYSRSI